MKNQTNEVMNKMLSLYSGDPKRIQHFMKVYTFAKYIGEEEGLEEEKQKILELSALVHDIGIHSAEQKYNSTSGKYQEIEGPPLAEKLLEESGIPHEMVERICFLVAHHHTYDQVDDVDYQILLEADFLVNAYEDNLPEASIAKGMENIFKTCTGIDMGQKMFEIERDM